MESASCMRRVFPIPRSPVMSVWRFWRRLVMIWWSSAERPMKNVSWRRSVFCLKGVHITFNHLPSASRENLGVHFLFLAEKKTNQKKRAPRENASDFVGNVACPVMRNEMRMPSSFPSKGRGRYLPLNAECATLQAGIRNLLFVICSEGHFGWGLDPVIGAQ